MSDIKKCQACGELYDYCDLASRKNKQMCPECNRRKNSREAHQKYMAKPGIRAAATKRTNEYAKRKREASQ